jgi:hypothetical protein
MADAIKSVDLRVILSTLQVPLYNAIHAPEAQIIEPITTPVTQFLEHTMLAAALDSSRIPI